MVELNQAAIRMLTRKPDVTITVDAETGRLMADLANQAGANIPTLLSKLAQRYNRCSWFERMAIIKFLNGV